jgi:hypothetical protein
MSIEVQSSSEAGLPPGIIIVNGQQVAASQREMTFDEVCRLAFPSGPFGEQIAYTVTYSYPSGTGEFVLNKGQSVRIESGMVIDVGNTDRS